MILGTPRGFRDILPTEALARERISDVVRGIFADAGYVPVETPLLEDRSVLERGGRLKGSPFRLFDSDGHLLVLRPDLTLPVARMAAGRMGGTGLPLRLRYCAPVVRERQSLRGQPRQFTQLGIELIGERGEDAELEVLTLLAKVLDELGVDAWRIVCGSVSPLTSLLDACSLSEEFSAQALALVHGSDLVGLDELVAGSGLVSPAAKALSRIPRIHGDASALDEVDQLLEASGVPAERRGTEELRSLVAALPADVVASHLSFDFSIINSFDYYTGIVFKAYADGIAASLASGGRYDKVLANLGMTGVSACGFALSLERLQEVLGEQGESGVVSAGVRVGERPLRIAVPKGSLKEDTVRVLEEAGLPVGELREPGRRLIIPAGDVEYVIVRAQDAPDFVAYGGADCGFCGSDSLIEADRELLTLVDCRYGACRFIVAESRSRAGKAEEAYAWRGTMRVATKYPRITQAYYDRIGQQVDILSLHGNIELGPIVGMADRIVDITATGTTLRENDLVIVDEVMSCTARFFANPSAYRCDARVRALADRLAEVVAADEAKGDAE